MLYKGSGVALVTPFKEDYSIDFDTYGNLIEWHIAQGTDAIITCGTTGEAASMTVAEHQAVIKYAVQKVRGRIPVIAGTGSNNTQHAVQMSQYAEQVGVDGLLVVTPYYNRSSQAGLIAHFTTIADQVGIPIILYNVPSRTGCNLKPQTVAKLAQHVNIVGIKEASGNISQIAETSYLCGKDFLLYSGNDDHIVSVLALGGVGVISVVANLLPKETSQLVHAFLVGKTQQACQLQLQMNGLIRGLFLENNPIPVKKAMNLMGLCSGIMRLPLVEMQPDTAMILKQEMMAYGLLGE